MQQIKWFWRWIRSLEQTDLAKFLQFVTGTSKVPLQVEKVIACAFVTPYQIFRASRNWKV